MHIYESKTVILPAREMYAILQTWETIEPKAALPLLIFRRVQKPSRRKKGGRCNVCYISGFNPDWNTRCRPCEFDLSDLQGEKEIAATTTNSDG